MMIIITAGTNLSTTAESARCVNVSTFLVLNKQTNEFGHFKQKEYYSGEPTRPRYEFRMR